MPVRERAMEKMAAAIGTADLGEPSEIKAAADGDADPFSGLVNGTAVGSGDPD